MILPHCGTNLCDDPKILALRLTALESVKPLNKIDRSFWPKNLWRKKKYEKGLDIETWADCKTLDNSSPCSRIFFPD